MSAELLTKVICFFSDGSSALLQTASKGKTAKKKTKGEEGTLLICYYKHREVNKRQIVNSEHHSALYFKNKTFEFLS